LIWTPPALADVQRLYRFLAPKDLDVAKRAVKAIREGVNILGDHAYAGRPAEGMEPPFREWPVSFGAGSYIVLYRVEGDEVSLLVIRPGREAGFSRDSLTSPLPETWFRLCWEYLKDIHQISPIMAAMRP
jgi:plasmid stabilization system protein ParE